MKHNLVWHPAGWADYLFWQKNEPKLLKKINELIKEIDRQPFTGIGKPEPLKYALEGCWSRRITQEHRLVYQVTKKEIIILQCRYHYQ